MLITPTKSCIIDVNLYPHSQAVKNVSEDLGTGQRCTIYSVKTGPFQHDAPNVSTIPVCALHVSRTVSTPA